MDSRPIAMTSWLLQLHRSWTRIWWESNGRSHGNIKLQSECFPTSKVILAQTFQCQSITRRVFVMTQNWVMSRQSLELEGIYLGWETKESSIRLNSLRAWNDMSMPILQVGGIKLIHMMRVILCRKRALLSNMLTVWYIGQANFRPRLH